MARRRKPAPLPEPPGSEADERRRFGGYTEAEIDRELHRSLRSDPFSIAIRVAVLALVYWLLARAIVKFDLRAGYLWIPLMVELLAVFWIGLLLSRLVIDCKAFRKSAGVIGVLGWSVALIAGIAATVHWYARLEAPADAPDSANYAAVFATLRATSLDLAMLAMVVGLLLASIPEVLRWRRERGVFVWMAATGTGFRLGMLFLLGILGFVAWVMFSGGDLPQPERWNWPWITWGVLLAADVAALVVATLMHRELLQERKPRAARP